ncbi:hypothetical protein SAMN04515674_102258 [Pseudarcicella hirudinis]|uniref:YhhN-like protein n=1 Tax=Pseudarcicella hirudinis TaxID=1079859 RepID=A0A1I5P3G9_9BACT|nr:hypothetical protein SAMN04515674_102258 [Pseudarcicella hirudinis]
MTYYYIYFSILIIGLIIGFTRIKSLNRSSRILLLLLALTILSESVATYLKFSARNNIIVYHIFSPIEFALISALYYNEIKNKIILVLMIIFISFACFNSINIQYFNTDFNSISFVISGLLTIIFSLWYLYLLILEKTHYNFTNYPLFWISVGFMFFNIINLFILGTYNLIALKFPEVGFLFRSIRFISNYSLYLFFTISFLCSQKSLDEV